MVEAHSFKGNVVFLYSTRAKPSTAQARSVKQQHWEAFSAGLWNFRGPTPTKQFQKTVLVKSRLWALKSVKGYFPLTLQWLGHNHLRAESP